MPDLQSFLLWGTLRAVVLTPLVLVFEAFANDAKALAKATQDGIELADVGPVLEAVPTWPAVLVVAAGVAYVLPYLPDTEGGGHGGDFED
jgi:hypothetical protein